MSETAVETPAPEAKVRKPRIKRTQVELKAARVEKARKAVERLENQRAAKVEKAVDLERKAAEARAATNEHEADLELAQRNLAWEQSRPVKGEANVSGPQDNLSFDGDPNDDAPETEDDLDDDFEDDFEGTEADDNI